jgi:putative membrane protein
LSATPHTESTLHPRLRWRRAALAASVIAFAVLWVGGVADQWLGRAHDGRGWLASLFLLLAGLIVLLGTHTRRETLTLVGVALMGFAVEAVGVRSGLPFGEYAYTDVLQPQLLGVPVVMGFAWMALVAFASDLAGRFRLSPWPAAVVGALWTTATDLVIDPLAANHFGYWTWARGGSYYGIPFTNFVGWFVTGLLACRLLGTRRQPSFWAGFVGTAILLFFASIALANFLTPVALLGFGLCALWLSVLTRFRSS